MAFKDILNKGMAMISKGAESAKTAMKEKKQASQEFDLLKTKSDHIGPMETYVVNNPDPQAGKEQTILSTCFTINVDNSKVVNKLIPIEETILDVKTGREAKTEIQYAFVITDKCLWVLNQNEYKKYTFDSITNFELVNKGLMSQGVKFDNNAFIIDCSEGDLKKFADVLMNKEHREDVIKRKTAYLCGVIPKKQLLNMNNRGVTFDNAGKIVLHSGTENKVLNVSDIQVVQLLVNDTVSLSRGLSDSGNFVSSPMEARKMSLKFILKMGEYTINILEPNMLNSTYKREEQTYITNYEFGKTVIDTTLEYMKENNFTSPVQNPTPVVEQMSVPVQPVASPVEPAPVLTAQPSVNPSPVIPVSTITTTNQNIVPPDAPQVAPTPTQNATPTVENKPLLDPFGISSNDGHQN
ncbi:MAG TPA: hypothetical protein DCY94_04310 [Firmicutes bacterium]|nr:hypothetical protein [Bacillota bacterium]